MNFNSGGRVVAGSNPVIPTLEQVAELLVLLLFLLPLHVVCKPTMKATKKARKACYLLGRDDWDSLLGGCRIRCIAGYALIFNGNPASLRLKPLRFESSHPDKVEQTAGEILRSFFCVPSHACMSLGSQ